MGRLACFGVVACALAVVPATPGTVRSQPAGDDESEIRRVVTEAYVEGIHKNGSRTAIRKGFHPDFVMKVLVDGGVQDVTIEEWISRLPKEGTPPQYEVTHRMPRVLLTGDAAVAVVELLRDGRHVFTDYISLYRFPEGWRIVAKIFYRHTGAVGMAITPPPA